MNVQIVRSAPSLTPSLAAMSEISGGAERCFLDNLEVLCNAVGGIEAVRHLVLALATRGRLVPQLAHETPTRMGTAVPLEDVPWSPPKGWAWLRWVDVSERIGDIDHKMPIEAAAGYPYVSPRDFLPNNQINYDAAKKISREAFLRLSEKIRPEKGDLIFSRYGTLGETRLVETDREFLASYSCAIVKCRREFCSPKYVYYYAQSPLVQSEIARYVNTTTQGNVGVKSIKMFMFPLPPLAEQERIVAKVDELMRMLDDLEAKQTKKRETQTRLRWAALGALTSAPGPEEFNAAWKRVADNFEVLFNGVQSVADLRVTMWRPNAGSSVRYWEMRVRLVIYLDWLAALPTSLELFPTMRCLLAGRRSRSGRFLKSELEVRRRRPTRSTGSMARCRGLRAPRRTTTRFAIRPTS